jgi:hypothetical protein
MLKMCLPNKDRDSLRLQKALSSFLCILAYYHIHYKCKHETGIQTVLYFIYTKQNLSEHQVPTDLSLLTDYYFFKKLFVFISIHIERLELGPLCLLAVASGEAVFLCSKNERGLL